jgi:hypothetical protein
MAETDGQAFGAEIVANDPHRYIGAGADCAANG